MRDAITEEEMGVYVAKINKELNALKKKADEYTSLLNASSRRLQSTDMVKKMIAAIRQGIEDEKHGIKVLSLREKRSVIGMLVNEIIIEFQGEEVI